MKNKNSLIPGIIMFVLATVFVLFALTKPGFSFPWSNSITRVVFFIYVFLMVTYLFIVALRGKKAPKKK